MLEWKWDGIRAQLVKRGGAVHLWSRGEELITHRFPEIAAAATHLPDGTVLDGEVLAFRDDRPLPFSALQQRIGRQKQVAQMARAVPVVFMTYDLLEQDGEDIRDAAAAASGASGWSSCSLGPSAGVLPGLARRSRPRAGRSSPSSAASRATRGVEGLMLKRASSAYGVGRKRGDWWKWKIEPYTIDAVLIYAQPGSGKRASLLTDYTFGVWDDGELVPVAKAYSGLSNEEIGEMDRWIRRHTLRALRAGAPRRAGARLRARLRRHRPLAAAPVRHRRPLSAHAALAQGQARGGGGHARERAAAAGVGRGLSDARVTRCTPVTTPAAGRHDDTKITKSTKSTGQTLRS